MSEHVDAANYLQITDSTIGDHDAIRFETDRESEIVPCHSRLYAGFLLGPKEAPSEFFFQYQKVLFFERKRASHFDGWELVPVCVNPDPNHPGLVCVTDCHFAMGTKVHYLGLSEKIPKVDGFSYLLPDDIDGLVKHIDIIWEKEKQRAAQKRRP